MWPIAGWLVSAILPGLTRQTAREECRRKVAQDPQQQQQALSLLISSQKAAAKASGGQTLPWSEAHLLGVAVTDLLKTLCERDFINTCKGGSSSRKTAQPTERIESGKAL